MKLIVGLGNPGCEYNNTRHNVGFMVIDNIVSKLGISYSSKFNGEYAVYNYNKDKIILLKPQKYMNLSGEVIKKYVDYFKINIDDLLIIHDDLDTILGNLRLRMQGSSGGHNGLKNIEYNLKTQKYKRIKIGISNNKQISTVDYVLGKFSKEEMITLSKVINITYNLFQDYLVMSYENLMNKYNQKNHD